MKGALWLGLAAALGLWADGISSERGIARWFEENAPPPEAWRAVFASRGLHEIRDPKTLDRARRALPSMTDDPGSAWIASEAAWAALFEGAETGREALVFAPSRAAAKPPTAAAWEPLGTGWPALVAALAALHRPAETPAPPRSRRSQRPDPRRIDY